MKHHLTAGNKRDAFVQESTIILVAHVFPQLRGRESFGLPFLDLPLFKVMVKFSEWQKENNCIFLKGSIFALVPAGVEMIVVSQEP